MKDPTRCLEFDHTCDDCMLEWPHLDPEEINDLGGTMNVQKLFDTITSKYVKHAAELQDGAVFAYIAKQLDYLKAAGLSPADYEVIIVRDEFPKTTDDGYKVDYRIRLVRLEISPPKVQLTFHGIISGQPDPRRTMMDDSDSSSTQTFVVEPGQEMKLADPEQFDQLSVVVDGVTTPGLMTGQEWYDRFTKELWVPPVQEPLVNKNDDGESHDRFYRNGGLNFMYNSALKAAKKAAGVE